MTISIKFPNVFSFQNCTCAGKFTTIQLTKELVQLLRTFASVAQHYKMTLLTEVISTIFKMNNISVGKV